MQRDTRRLLPNNVHGAIEICWTCFLRALQLIKSCGPTVVQQLCPCVFSTTFCRSRRRQVFEMHCCRSFCWAHNPKVGGSNPPPATNLKVFCVNHMNMIA
jgi:hypothetical protein